MSLGGPTALHSDLSALVKTCSKGGLSATLYTKAPNALEGYDTASALFPAFVLSLEAANWELLALMDSNRSRLMAKAVLEALVVNHARRGEKFSGLNVGITQLLVKLAAHFAGVHGMQLFPMDLQVYLKYHFTKVGDQMLEHLVEYRTLAERLSTPHAAMDELKGEIETLRSKRD